MINLNVIHSLWVRNLKAFIRNKPALVINLVFPFFFIFVFGEVFKLGEIESAEAYALAGIIMATVFDSSMRISSSTIDDISSGFMKEVLVSPVSRLSIAIGQFASSATVAATQGLIIFGVGFFIGVRITTPLTIVYVIAAMIFTGLIFAGFGLLLATKSKNIQTFQAVTMAITMPMTFLSGAYLPLSMLNPALATVSYFNPLTYAVVFFRTIALEKTNLPPEVLVSERVSFEIGSFIVTPLMSALILLLLGAVFISLATITFVNVDFSRINRNKNDSMMEDI
ncbi:MAG: ABC transporter permease [Oscillospiraceae bacterium]|nr:ABC transporter permease [Oscillospiraceae bacterium]